MSGRIISTPAPSVHVCGGKPDPQGLATGTRWQCDDCRHVWKVEVTRAPSGWGMEAFWRDMGALRSVPADREGTDA